MKNSNTGKQALKLEKWVRDHLVEGAMKPELHSRSNGGFSKIENEGDILFQ